MKVRMTSVDVAAECACLRQKLLGMRLANMYDLSAKTYVLKLSRSGEEGEKVFLLLESGSRFHTTELIRDKADVPSNFTLKLRKHLRTRRLEDVRQLGVDRIVDFVFGSGEATMHLILEMYSQGNIVLTNAHYEVLTLLRSHRDDDKGFAVMARHLYPMQHVRLHQAITLPELTAALQSPGPEPGTNLKAALAGSVLPYGPTIAEHVILDAGLNPGMKLKPMPKEDSPAAHDAASGDGFTGVAGVEAGEGPAKALGKGEQVYAVTGNEDARDAEGPDPAAVEAAAEAVAAGGGKKGKWKGKQQAANAEQQAMWCVISDEELGQLHAALKRLDAWFAGLETQTPMGVITCLPAPQKQQQQQQQQHKGVRKSGRQQQADGPGAEGTKEGEEMPVVYNDFNPLLLTQLKGTQNIEFPSFDLALDDFYGKSEGQRAAFARADAERNAMSKVERIKMDQSARVQSLAAEADQAELRASLIQYNLEAVEAAIRAVNEMLATGMDWHDLDALIKDERKAGNPVAQLIHSLQLNTNHITLLLSNYLDTEDEGNEAANTRKATKVPVDLSLTAHANSSIHFEQKKKHVAKQAKTVAAHEQSLKVAEKKALEQVQKVQAVPMAQVQRKPLWFEKFNWFISSENYLVISGRDAQQNELIVKRYFVKGDAYIHAELHGASSTIVKNPNPERSIPPITLQQAGCACVCRSRAWDSKVVTSAWWVNRHQVSKTAPTGEYLPTGSFMVRGRKNFLPPQPLIFGFGFMFKLEDSCIGNHIGERAIRGGMDGDTTSVAFGGQGGNDAGDVDIDDFGLNLPGDEEEEGTIANKDQLGGSNSALDAFMEGGYGSFKHQPSKPTATANSTASTATARGVGLSSKAIAAAGTELPSAGADVNRQFERYNLQAEAEPQEEEQEEQSQQQGAQPAAANANATSEAGQAGKRHISQKEREMMKKAKQKAQKAQDEAAKGGAVPVQKQEQQQQKGKGKAEHQGGKKEGQLKQQQDLANQAAKKQAALQQQLLQQHEAIARGKKAKLARIKEKYADQDEEERQLALAMLASHGEKKSRADRRKEGKGKKEASRQAGQADFVGLDKSTMEDAILKATTSQWQQHEEEGGEQGEGSSNSSGSEDDKQQGQQQQGQVGVAAASSTTDGPGDAQTKSRSEKGWVQQGGGINSKGGVQGGGSGGKGGAQGWVSRGTGGEGQEEEEDGGGVPEVPLDEAEQAEVKALLAEENIAVLAEEDKEKLTVLDSLTGCPRPEDTLLFALPVCAPFQTLQNYKYKVKVVPGTIKKGKAARQGMELLARIPEATQRERDLIRGVPEIGMINAMVGTVKISMPGMTKLRQDDKKSKKAAAKAKHT